MEQALIADVLRADAVAFRDLAQSRNEWLAVAFAYLCEWSLKLLNEGQSGSPMSPLRR
jgi:hypothetical protein